MRRQRNILQTKEQGKTSEKELNEVEISNLPDKEFKVTIIKMFTELRRRMDEHSENVNKEIKKHKKVPNKSYN